MILEIMAGEDLKAGDVVRPATKYKVSHEPR